MNTYDINQLLSDASIAGGFTDFLIGHDSYKNREGAFTFPACWIQLLEFDINVSKAISFDNTYFINGYVCDKCKMDKSPNNIQTVIASLRPKLEKMLAYLFEHCEEVIGVVKVAQQIYRYDNITVGYDFFVVVKIAEDHTYC